MLVFVLSLTCKDTELLKSRKAAVGEIRSCSLLPLCKACVFCPCENLFLKSGKIKERWTKKKAFTVWGSVRIITVSLFWIKIRFTVFVLKLGNSCHIS